jgi:hypothetical protein
MSQTATLSRPVPAPGHIPEPLQQAFSPKAMLALKDDIRALDPEHPPKFHGGHVIGVDTLPIVWDV